MQQETKRKTWTRSFLWVVSFLRYKAFSACYVFGVISLLNIEFLPTFITDTHRLVLSLQVVLLLSILLNYIIIFKLNHVILLMEKSISNLHSEIILQIWNTEKFWLFSEILMRSDSLLKYSFCISYVLSLKKGEVDSFGWPLLPHLPSGWFLTRTCYRVFDVTFQKQACMAIRNIVARTRDHCSAILTLGAEELINQARNLKECEDEAKAALRDLDCQVDLKMSWTGEKGSLPQTAYWSSCFIRNCFSVLKFDYVALFYLKVLSAELQNLQ